MCKPNGALEVRTHISVIEKRSGTVFAGSDVADAEAVRASPVVW
jgi:hypothetical protein